MARKRKNSKKENNKEKLPRFIFLNKTQRQIWAVVILLLSLLVILSFFNFAGPAGESFMKAFIFLLGKVTFIVPFFLILAALAILKKSSFPRIYLPVFFSLFLLIAGITGILATFSPQQKLGGNFGYYLSFPLLKLFNILATRIIFAAIIVVGSLILGQFFWPESEKKKAEEERVPKEPSFFKKIFAPKFKLKEIEPEPKSKTGVLNHTFLDEKKEEREGALFFPEPGLEKIGAKGKKLPALYQPFPLNLLESDKGKPETGDIKINSAIIKRTLQNFDIPVEMGEVNIGPTVTQYTLKPAEGIKLSRITALSNDLALALAVHPIRIEAPIPGRPLVGIEVPNKVRTRVRLRNLLEEPAIQNTSSLTLALGRNVDGAAVFADLAKMPHLLVAGATGTGKTICLNSLVLTLLYRNSPEILRFILIDPKRVEFPIYNEIPHLLAPVITQADKTILALKWLTKEMERRFEVLSSVKARDIAAFNQMALKRESEPLPYIVLIIDELADLMAAKGREIEAGIVRLAQMSRAVGIHLIVATQRPSVEVITGLIKANITSRITFQVASQTDSRTVLDMGGAEKLLGSGDMLFVSAEITKPKRIQGAFISDKEVKRVVNFINSQYQEQVQKTPLPETKELNLELSQVMEKPEFEKIEEFEGSYGEDDPLYPDAERVVIEAKKASASLLQRRLRIGYARAARLIDILEEKGVVGPGEGAKPREVYILPENPENTNQNG